MLESAAAFHLPATCDAPVHRPVLVATPSREARGAHGRPSTLSPARRAAIRSEADLGQALMDRRPEALPAAWSRYHALVRGILRRALGADADVDDVVQEVFLCLFRRASALRDREAVRSFVIGIARHMLQRELRMKLRRRRLAQEYAPCSRQSLDSSSGAAGGYAAGKLAELLGRLSEQERTAFVLRFAHGLTVLEIAQILRVSEPTAKRRVNRARRHLLTWAGKDFALHDYIRGARFGVIPGLIA